MKIMGIIFLFIIALLTTGSCNKSKLDQPVLGDLTESQVTNSRGIEMLLIGAYSLLDGIDENGGAWGASGSNWIYGSVCGTEGHKGSYLMDAEDILQVEEFIATPFNDMIAQKWSAVYEGINRTNTVLRLMKKASDIKPEDANRIAAEARFLRGFYHFEALKMWHNVPYVNDSITYEAGNYHISNTTLIWPYVEADFKFATENLPEVMHAVGRANKYAAEAFLAKLFMFEHKFSDAKPLFDNIISNGVTAIGVPYKLSQHYSDNFDPATKNSSESIFAVQNSVNDGSQGMNGNLGDILNYPVNGGPGSCCGFFQPSQYLVNHFKTIASGLPDLDNFDQSDVTNDQGITSDVPFTPYTGYLDPRLDWTVGRRGIPYLDWGNHPGFDWIRDQTSGGPYSPIKNTYYKSQMNHFTDQSFWTTGSTATNINLMRFADLLLLAAEDEAELGNLDNAEDYVNMVRNRAADSSGWVYNYNDPSIPSAGHSATPAANYHIKPYPAGYFSMHTQDFVRKAIRYERMLELGMEGHRFFDLVRWGIAKNEIDRYLHNESKLTSYLNSANFIQGQHEYFPIPQTQIDLSKGPDGKSGMTQNPGY